MSRPLIWVDCDGVLADFHGAFLDIVEEVVGRRHTVEECTAWEFKDCILTEDEDRACWEEMHRRPGFVQNLRTLPFWHYLPALREFAEVRCLTSPSVGPYWMHERMLWLMDVAGFKKSQIVQASDKSVVHGDVLVDDANHNCLAFFTAKGNEDAEVLLISQPYNVCSDMSWLASRRVSPQAAFARLVSSFKGAR